MSRRRSLPSISSRTPTSRVCRRAPLGPDFWSAHVNRALRITLYKREGDTLLAYGGHHDDTYDGPARGRLVGIPGPARRRSTSAKQWRRQVEEERARGGVPAAPANGRVAVCLARGPAAQVAEMSLADLPKVSFGGGLDAPIPVGFMSSNELLEHCVGVWWGCNMSSMSLEIAGAPVRHSNELGKAVFAGQVSECADLIRRACVERSRQSSLKTRMLRGSTTYGA